jgi:FkbM family methyltransferase
LEGALTRSEFAGHDGQVLGRRGALVAGVGKLIGRQLPLRVKREELAFPFELRLPSSDSSVYRQVFLEREYEFEVRREPEVIVDGGANIGLTSIYFASRYPRAMILAVEPETSNFALLCKNVAPYPGVIPVQAALWSEDGEIDVLKNDMGKWAFMTRSAGDEDAHPGEFVERTRATTVGALMREHGLERIDILKLDVEGAERELFADCSAWLGAVDAIVIELHDRYKPGCTESFRRGVTGFEREWRSGENYYLARPGSCIKMPGN